MLKLSSSALRLSIVKLANSKFTLPVLAGLLIILSISALVVANKQTEHAGSERGMDELSIWSFPSGVVTLDKTDCNSPVKTQTTPLTCRLDTFKKSTTLTAKAEVQKDGKTYYFDSWQGCVETDISLRTCKATPASTHVLVVNYRETKDTPNGDSVIYKQVSPNANLCKMSTENDMTVCTAKITFSTKKQINYYQTYNKKDPSDSHRTGLETMCSPQGACEPGWGLYQSKVVASATLTVKVSNESSSVHCGTLYCGPAIEKFKIHSIDVVDDPYEVAVYLNYDYICTYSYEGGGISSYPPYAATTTGCSQ